MNAKAIFINSIENNSISKKNNRINKHEIDNIIALDFLIGIIKGHFLIFIKYIDWIIRI